MGRAAGDASPEGLLLGWALRRVHCRDPVFGLHVITHCPDVPTEILLPRATWKDSAAYDRAARKLAGLFTQNFQKYAAVAGEEVRAAGPAA